MAVKSLAQSSILQPSTTNSLLGEHDSNYYHHLETVRLGANAASVTFSNLQRYSDYQHFQIRAVARMTYSDPERSLTIQFNGDTGVNYYMHGLYGTGSSVGSYGFSGSSIFLGSFPAANGTGSVFTGCVADILDPFEAKNKVVRSLAGAHWSQPAVSLRSGIWVNTAAVTSITLVDATSNLVTGSRFSLYGIKAR